MSVGAGITGSVVSLGIILGVGYAILKRKGKM